MIMNGLEGDDDDDREDNASDIEDVGDDNDDDVDSADAVAQKLPAHASTSNTHKKGKGMTSDWELDSNDERAPSFAPGSTRDEDWKERDLEAARGFGMENSYGVVTDPQNALGTSPYPCLIIRIITL